jgi:hypothetical protein
LYYPHKKTSEGLTQKFQFFKPTKHSQFYWISGQLLWEKLALGFSATIIAFYGIGNRNWFFSVLTIIAFNSISQILVFFGLSHLTVKLS